MGEHAAEDRGVLGSNPSGPTKPAFCFAKAWGKFPKAFSSEARKRLMLMRNPLEVPLMKHYAAEKR